MPFGLNGMRRESVGDGVGKNDGFSLSCGVVREGEYRFGMRDLRREGVGRGRVVVSARGELCEETA